VAELVERGRWDRFGTYVTFRFIPTNSGVPRKKATPFGSNAGKAKSHDIRISDIQLDSKTGGKSDYERKA